MGLHAQTVPQKLPDPVTVDIQFHDQQNYYEQDDVFVKVTLTNNSPAVYRFRLADNRQFSMDFSVQTLANMSTPLSETYQRTISATKSVFTREVSLNSGEEFSWVERLGDYRVFPAGTYVVTAYFYPELRNNSLYQPLMSNRLTLQVRPDARRSLAVEEQTMDMVKQLIRTQALPPDQVVDRTLRARMAGMEEEYFLYIDLESLYAKDAPRAASWRRMSELDRINALEGYRRLVWDSGADTIIPRIPAEFEIMKTSHDNRTATVEVLQKYRTRAIIERWHVVYHLTKVDQIWYIKDWVPTFKGTE